jgi:hypothetical protein
MAQQTASDAEELADRHDGVDVSREQLSGTFEYQVVLKTATVESLPGSISADEFAENIATSRFNKEVDPTFGVRSSDAMAKEDTDYTMNGERRFTVWVRFDKND